MTFDFQLHQIEKIVFFIKDTLTFESIKENITNLNEMAERWIQSNFDAWTQHSLEMNASGELS